MYLYKITYQLGVRLKSLVPYFHKSHLDNLVLLVIRVAYNGSVNLPKAEAAVPYKRIHVESRIQRFERLLQCEKFVPLAVLKPVARQILKDFYRQGKGAIEVVMDRSMINDTLNFLHLTVCFGGRALPHGWVRVPHKVSSNLALQHQLLNWFKECLPRGLTATIIADREFHSIELATWMAQALGLNFVLRIKTGTYLDYRGG